MGEAVFSCHMGHRFKPHKSPWSQRHDAEDTHAGRFRIRKSGRQSGSSALCQSQQEAGNHAKEQHKGEDRVDAPLDLFLAEGDHAKQEHNTDGCKNLPKVNIVARHLIVEAKGQRISEHLPEDQDKRRGIGPNQGGIGDPQKPAAEKTVVVSKHLFCKGKRAAVIRVTVYHVMIVCGNEDHHRRADGHGNRGSPRSGGGEKRRSGHDKAAPSYTTAKGQRPNAEPGIGLGFHSVSPPAPDAADFS